MDGLVHAPTRDRNWWVSLGALALREFFGREGAAVWAEVEARICEGSWIHYQFDSRIPPHWQPHQLYLGLSRAGLAGAGELIELPVSLGGMPVSAWADATSLARYRDLRDRHDRQRWIEFCAELIGAGLCETGGWAPASSFPQEEAEGEWFDDGYEGP